MRQSPKLLRDRGFLYDSSLMDTDHPFVGAIAEHVRGPGLTPRSIERPYLADY